MVLKYLINILEDCKTSICLNKFLFVGTQLKMTDLNMIRVIPICGKVNEWPIWSEKFLAKSRCFGFKDLLLEKMSIPTVDEGFEPGKKKYVVEMLSIFRTDPEAYDDKSRSI
jgi:hypothetical protein